MARKTRPAPQAVPVATLNGGKALSEYLTNDPEGVFRGARLLASTVFWTFAPAIKALIPKFFERPMEASAMGLHTYAVDKYYRCYVNSDFTKFMVAQAKAVSPQQPCPVCGATTHHDFAYVAGVICHEAQHPSRQHMQRSTASQFSNHKLANISADLELNDDLLEIFEKEHASSKAMYDRPKLCLPWFPRLVATYNGKRIIDATCSWTSLSPQRMVNETTAVAIIEACTTEEEKVEALSNFIYFNGDQGDDVLTMTYDGYGIIIDELGKRLVPGDSINFGGYTLTYSPGKCMIPETFREWPYSETGVEIEDDKTHEVYYYLLQDMYDKLDSMKKDKKKDSKGDEKDKKKDKNKGDDKGEKPDPNGDNKGDDKGEKPDPNGDDKGDDKGDPSDDGEPKPDPNGDKEDPNGAPKAGEGHNPFENPNNRGDGEATDCGSGASGQSQEWEDGDPTGDNPGISEGEARAISREIAKEVKKGKATGRGHVPAGMEMWADEVLKPSKVDWRKNFRTSVRFAVQRAYGHERRSWQRLGRSSASTGYKLLYPSTFNPVPKIGIVLDTSGSMGWGKDSALYDAFCEVEAIVRQVGADIMFVSVDASAGEIQHVKSLKKAKITGGGGTDMRIGIEALLKHREPPQVIVVLTDGDTPWPDTAPRKCKLLAGIVGGHGSRNVPSFIRVLDIELANKEK